MEAVAKTAENQVNAAVPHSAGPLAAACVGLRATLWLQSRPLAAACVGLSLRGSPGFTHLRHPQARALAQTAAAKAQLAENALATSALGKQVAAVAKSAENQV